ncbi:HugZ family protein [Aquisphaera insulae]|uniref:HugZ family pyridoxamine 5'-phosphate oxidase n=1 Tax=Aquisphaera insulae TaxID=2712864 RepID=UPI0013EBC15D|nr:pyridoxamine 5'-phosphate oxidase family protein [Aquisphaera insulae]
MDHQAREALAHLVRSQRVASLGTLFQGVPLVTMVPYSPTPAPTTFDIHVSRLAQHTQGLLASSRVGLLIAEPDRETRNPQAIPRLSLQGEAVILSPGDSGYREARAAYLGKFPSAAMNFDLGDFLLVRITPESSRFVAGFGRIFDLAADDLDSIWDPRE